MYRGRVGPPCGSALSSRNRVRDLFLYSSQGRADPAPTVVLYSCCCRSVMYFCCAKVPKRPAYGKSSQTALCCNKLLPHPNSLPALPYSNSSSFSTPSRLCRTPSLKRGRVYFLPYRGAIVCSDEESPFQHIFPFSFFLSSFSFLLSPFYFEFSPDVEMTMFQCATIGRIALNIVYNPFTKVHYTYAGGKSANGIREFFIIL